MRRYADLTTIPPQQRGIDLRLVNWARWARVYQSRFVAPMFRLYRPENNEAEGYTHEDKPPPIDPSDAIKVEKGVVQLPDAHKAAVFWFYRIGTRPTAACRAIGVSREGLASLIVDGRQMLVNRGI